MFALDHLFEDIEKEYFYHKLHGIFRHKKKIIVHKPLASCISITHVTLHIIV